MKNSNDVSIRKVNKNDNKNLEEFYYVAYGERARYKFPERWSWLYKNNPWKKGENPHNYIAVNSEGCIIGHTGTMRVPCKVHKKSLVMGWSVDTIVLPQYRGQGIGTKLQKANQNDNKLFASLSMSPANKHVKKKIGANEGPVCAGYVSFVNFSAKNQLQSIKENFEKHFNSIVSYLLALIMFPFNFLIAFFVYQEKYSSNCELNSLDLKTKSANFKKDHENLWQSIRGNYDFAVERNVKYLQWRYEQVPWCDYRIVELKNPQQDLLGFSIYRLAQAPEHKMGIISELIIEPKGTKTIKKLLKKTISELVERGAGQIIFFSSCEHISKVTKKIGFSKFESKRLVYNLQEEDCKIKNNYQIMLSAGDQDWDQYPRSREVIACWPFLMKLGFLEKIDRFKSLLARIIK